MLFSITLSYYFTDLFAYIVLTRSYDFVLVLRNPSSSQKKYSLERHYNQIGQKRETRSAAVRRTSFRGHYEVKRPVPEERNKKPCRIRNERRSVNDCSCYDQSFTGDGTQWWSSEEQGCSLIAYDTDPLYVRVMLTRRKYLTC